MDHKNLKSRFYLIILLNAIFNLSDSSLYAAAMFERTETEHNIDTEDDELIWAAKDNDISKVKLLIKYGANVNANFVVEYKIGIESVFINFVIGIIIMIKNSFIDYILDILSPIAGIRSKKMFGGYGIYKDNTFFALVSEDILYFKVDDTNRPDFQTYESKPFSYEGKNNKTIVMSYWQVPADILENQTELINWTEKSIIAAKRKMSAS